MLARNRGGELRKKLRELWGCGDEEVDRYLASAEARQGVLEASRILVNEFAVEVLQGVVGRAAEDRASAAAVLELAGVRAAEVVGDAVATEDAVGFSAVEEAFVEALRQAGGVSVSGVDE